MDGGERQFAVEFRKDSISGDIVLTTGNIRVRDVSTFVGALTDSIVATGGIVEDTEE